MFVRTPRPLALGVSAALVSTGLLLASPSLASAAGPTPKLSFGGYAFGSTASVGPVSSGQTSALSVCTATTDTTYSNKAASVDLGVALGSIGAVSSKLVTSTSSSVVTTETAGTSLLGGLIKASAITTSSTVSKDGDTYPTNGGAVFTDLVIAGKSVSTAPGVNSKIDIPGVATVTLNGQSVATTPASKQLTVTALRVDVLKNDLLKRAAGTIVIGNAAAYVHSPTVYRAGGAAYGSIVNLAGVVSSGPSFPVYMPCGGSNGKTVSNTAASLTIPSVVVAQGVNNTAMSSDTATGTTAVLQSKITGVNLLGGAVTADAITARATSKLDSGKLTGSSEGTEVTGLKIYGKSVTVDAADNSKIDIAGLGTLTVRKAVNVPGGFDVNGLELKLNTDTLGLKSGTVIQVAVAAARVSTN